MFQFIEETRPDSGGSEASADLTVVVGRFLHEPIKLLHLDDLTLHAGDFSNAGHPPAAIGKPLQLHDDMDCGRDLAADACNRHGQARHAHHPSGEGVFNVRRLAPESVFYIGRNARGFAAVLIETSDSGRTVPLKLAGIEASFSTPYRIVEPGKTATTQTLTAITCTNQEKDVTAYFANVMESLLPFLGKTLSTRKVAETVRQLVDLFQKLRSPSHRSLVGLIGELKVIDSASDVATAIRCWRTDPEERFDFGIGSLRLDVKASGNRKRVHEISFEQANPPEGAIGVIASIWIEAMAGGLSLSQLLGVIETKIVGRSEEVLRLRDIVANSLGDSLPQAMSWGFDNELAKSSLCYFDSTIIPAIRPPLPPGVSSARFVADLSGCPQIDMRNFREGLGVTEKGLLPND
jgi:hypothetical protein